jgi:hypothetical protein
MDIHKSISESVLLRILARKSIVWFGKYNGLSVQQIIDSQHGTYLRWIYYNITGITFTEDILEKLTISDNRKIKKPGIAPEMHSKIMEENREFLYFHTKSHMDKIIKIRAKNRFIKTYNSVNFKKSQLQAINLNRY